ncbi:ABC transporter ATP-binding protein [Sphingomonas abietis]|uniref:ABC transporter ATP-binding protein n=1 Tax=Sphingomonas abietis TaxID=3012344 RepID=A0ABY7NIZ2_9SPHN|nr:ABC transporter ATP-binding protein [Sphingomonas abietis]WBO21489.1 ABC transporter ATP-binding protein [Sphingomonas abietis]
MTDLTLRDIHLSRGRRPVLNGVSISFAGGRLTALIGPNGAGKSSLLSVAAGLLPPDAGEVRLGGEPLSAIGRKALARRRAYLPQSPQVDWPISVERVVALGLTAHLPAFGHLPLALHGAIDRALADHDLLELRDRPATSLSGGELARAMLARATVADPELLIVDEPTAGLDPRHAIDAVARLRARADAGRTVIMAIHDLDLALRVADDVVAVRDGQLLAAGPAAAILVSDVLERLYDVRARVVRDQEGVSIRFGR